MGETQGARQIAAGQIDRFAAILNWTLGLALVATVLYSIIAAVTATSALWLIVATCLLSGVGVGAARWLLGRKQLTLSIMLFVGTVLVSCLLVVTAMPLFYASAVVIAITTFMVVLPLADRRWLPQLLALVILMCCSSALIGEFTHLFAPIPAPLDSWLRLAGLMSVLALMMFAIWQHHSQLEAIVQQLQTSNGALAKARAGLEEQVEDRTVALQRAVADLEWRAVEEARLRKEIEQQRDAIRELSVPVLPILNDTLAMPLVGALDTSRITQVQEQALAAIQRSRARQLVIDVTGVPVVDTQVAQGLVQVVQAAKLIGTRVTLVGIRPEVAQTLVGLGLDLSGIRTMGDLQAALGEQKRAA